MTNEWLERLNTAQKQAVLHSGTPLLILAGAGSGKTRVITTKIAYLVQEQGVDPRSILAVTFTNKAAREMRERVAGMAPAAGDVMIRTFHSFGAWLLRRNAGLLGLDSRFSIYDDDDALTLLHGLYPAYKRKELQKYTRWISRAKDYALAPDNDLEAISSDPLFAEMYAAYEARLRRMGNADFGDLILRCVELLSEHDIVSRRLQGRFRYILVDEYQDSNVAQYEMLKKLAGPDTYLCVVGDDDQSIYRFRGAEVRNILTFADSFPGTEVIRLEENYRSTGNILAAAGAVVANNTGRLGKTLRANKEEGRRIVLAYLDNQDAEAEYCAELLSRSGNIGETAILYRTNAQSLAFERHFVRRNIPYQIVGSLRFYEREEIKDAMAMLAFLCNPRDEIAFRRIVNKPSRGLGKAAVGAVLAEAGNQGADLFEACRAVADISRGKRKKGLEEFVALYRGLRERLPNGILPDFLRYMLAASKLQDYYQEQDEIAFTQKAANLEEFVNAAAEYPAGMDGLVAFLEDIELDRSLLEDNAAEESGERVLLITMHNTKGLEFDRVIITGMDDGLFPSRREGMDDDDLEEERRIFYVSITRARSELYLTTCRRRLLWGRYQSYNPSPFLEELPPALLEVEGGGQKEAVENPYPPGTGIYHDDYGSEIVVKAWEENGHHVVMVRFETGQVSKFLPEYSPLEKVSYE